MKLRTVKCWRPKSGGTRYIRLYRAWWNMQSRLKGTTRSHGGANYWVGKPCGFLDWPHFREWSLKNGYSRERCSLDRERSDDGYTPDNCRWMTVSDNSSRTADTIALNKAISAFQRSPPTQEEQDELDQALGIWHCPRAATFN